MLSFLHLFFCCFFLHSFERDEEGMAAGPAVGTKVFTHLQERRGETGKKRKKKKKEKRHKCALQKEQIGSTAGGGKEGGREVRIGRKGRWWGGGFWCGGGEAEVDGRYGVGVGVGAKANLFTRSLKYKLQEARTFWWTSNSLPSTIIFRSVNSFALRCWLSSFNISVEQEKETDSATQGF